MQRDPDDHGQPAETLSLHGPATATTAPPEALPTALERAGLVDPPNGDLPEHELDELGDSIGFDGAQLEALFKRCEQFRDPLFGVSLRLRVAITLLPACIAQRPKAPADVEDPKARSVIMALDLAQCLIAFDRKREESAARKAAQRAVEAAAADEHQGGDGGGY